MPSLSLYDVAASVAKLKMYPYFDIANYILMCSLVREDAAASQPSSASSSSSSSSASSSSSSTSASAASPSSSSSSSTSPPSSTTTSTSITATTTETTAFSRKHPLSCWLSSMLMCFSTVILTNLLLGESPITPFTNNRDLLTASIVWYAMNYSPFDVTYKFYQLLPIRVIVACLKEVHRANKVYRGVSFALRAYPQSYVIIFTVGALKGAGYFYMRLFERLVRGTWIPTANEILQPTLATKTSLLATLVFVLRNLGYFETSHHVLYLYVIVFFLVFRLAFIVIDIRNPFVHFENVFCALFLGGIVDALKKAMSRESKPEESVPTKGGQASKTKTKEE